MVILLPIEGQNLSNVPQRESIPKHLPNKF